MKKLNPIIIFIFSQMGLLQAQQSLELGFATGTELSIPSSSNPNNVKDYNVLPGFNLAFRLQHNFERRYSLLGGIEYGRMYWIRTIDQIIWPETPQDHINIANQFRIPILFQVNFGKSRSQFYLNSGISFLITFQDRSGIGYYPESQLWVGTVPKFMLPWNIGGMLSVGYSYRMKEKMRFFAESRFLVPIVADANQSTNFNTTRNLTLGLTVGLSFTTSGMKTTAK